MPDRPESERVPPVTSPTLRPASVPETLREEHLRLVLETSPVGIWDLDVRSGAAWRNERHDMIFGYDSLQAEWTYQKFLDHVLPEDREAVDARYGGAIAAGEPWSFECRIRRADGEIRWIAATGRPILDEAEEVQQLIGHVIDVTHTKRNEEHLRVLLDELNHRVRNTLAVVQAIAARSFCEEIGLEQGRIDFSGRINALASAHSLLSDRSWTGATLAEVVDLMIWPHQRPETAAEPLCIEVTAGPRVPLSAKHAVTLSMALNELATNAVKHGALSRDSGCVDLTWRTLDARQPVDGLPASPDPSYPRVELIWQESGGPKVRQAARTGFGMTLLKRILPSDMEGNVHVSFDPEGLQCRILFDALPEEPGTLPRI